MTQLRDEQLSALLDGELPEQELDLVLARLDRDPELRQTVARYAMIGELARGGAAQPAALTLVERVRAELQAQAAAGSAPETIVPAASWRGWAPGAVAAAAVLVAVLAAGPLAWRSQPGVSGVEPVPMADVGESLPELVRPPATRRLDPRAAARLTGYLLAHGEYANSLARNNFDSHLVSAHAERASWQRTVDAGDGR